MKYLQIAIADIRTNQVYLACVLVAAIASPLLSIHGTIQLSDVVRIAVLTDLGIPALLVWWLVGVARDSGDLSALLGLPIARVEIIATKLFSAIGLSCFIALCSAVIIFAFTPPPSAFIIPMLVTPCLTIPCVSAAATALFLIFSSRAAFVGAFLVVLLSAKVGAPAIVKSASFLGSETTLIVSIVTAVVISFASAAIAASWWASRLERSLV